MPGRPAVTVRLSESHRSLLERLVRRQTSAQRLVRRIQIVLDASLGVTNRTIARRLNTTNAAVHHWRSIGASLTAELEELEAAYRLEELSESRIETLLVKAVDEAFADRPRPGTPPKFTAEQMVAIVAVALENPADCGRPVSHWTPREIADEVIKRGIVPHISVRSVGRFLKGERPQAASESVLAVARDRGSGGLRRGSEGGL